MTNKVLLFLLGIVFSGLAASAQTTYFTDEENHIKYSFDKSSVTKTSDGIAGTDGSLPCDVQPHITYNEDGSVKSAYAYAYIGQSTTTGNMKTYGTTMNGAVWKVNVTPYKLLEGSVAKLKTCQKDTSVVDTLSSNAKTVTKKSSQNAQMTAIVTSTFSDPTSADQEGYVFTTDRLKAILGDEYESATTVAGKALVDGACYVYYSDFNDETEEWTDGYIQVIKLTVYPYIVANTYKGTIYYNPTSIPSSFIAGNTDVTSVEIAPTVTSVAVGAFKGCSNLNTFVSNSTSFKVTNNILYNSTGSDLIAAPASLTGEITLAKTVTKIWDYAFNNNENLTVKHYGATINNTSTHGATVTFVKLTSDFTATPVYASDGTQVGVVLSGEITRASLKKKLASYSKLSYVDMTNVVITSKSSAYPLNYTPKTNQIYIYGAINSESANYYVDESVTNVVYKNSDGILYCGNYQLSETSTLNKNVYIPCNFRAGKATLNRSFTTTYGNYASLVVPFTFDEAPAGFTVWNITGYNTTKNRATWSSGGDITANVPCLVKYTTAQSSISGAADVIATTDLVVSSAPDGNVTMYGLYSNRECSDAIFDLNNDEDGRDYMFNSKGSFIAFATTNHIDAFRAYAHMPYEFGTGTSSSKESLIDMASDIDSTEADDNTVTEYYTSNGIKLDSMQNGVNVVRVVNSDGTVKSTKKIIK